MATVGYGDITSQSDSEYILCIFYMLFNLFLSAWVLGNMTILITQADESTRRFRNKFKNLESYLESNGFPHDIEDSLRSYLILQFNAAKEHREIMVNSIFLVIIFISMNELNRMSFLQFFVQK